MSQSQQTAPPPINWDSVLREAGPYPIEAFNFVREGLNYTADRVHEHVGADGGEFDRHISGQQLCIGLRDFAIDRYGLLAPAVLEYWQIRRTEDFGRIVFAMVDAGIMSKTDDDTLEDFRGVFHFDEAFAPDELLAQIGEE